MSLLSSVAVSLTPPRYVSIARRIVGWILLGGCLTLLVGTGLYAVGFSDGDPGFRVALFSAGMMFLAVLLMVVVSLVGAVHGMMQLPIARMQLLDILRASGGAIDIDSVIVHTGWSGQVLDLVMKRLIRRGLIGKRYGTRGHVTIVRKNVS